MSWLNYAVAIPLLLVLFLVVLVSLGRQFPFRVYSMARKTSAVPAEYRKTGVVSDILTRSVVKKVKVSKVGDYLILTLVLRTAVESSTEIEIEEPLVLLSDGEVIAKSNSGVDELSV